jgi:hypothetical protein
VLFTVRLGRGEAKMKRLRRREWKEVYNAWKERHPEMLGDANKPARKKLVRGCCMKIQYESYEEAMGVVTLLPVRDRRVLHAYECPICNGFHVGNTSAFGVGNYLAKQRRNPETCDTLIPREE